MSNILGGSFPPEFWEEYDKAQQALQAIPLSPLPDPFRTEPGEVNEGAKRGCYIIVWSQSGEAWADAVVKALGLEEYVNQTMPKPTSYGDDLPAEIWMQHQIYLEPDSKWRNNATNT